MKTKSYAFYRKIKKQPKIKTFRIFRSVKRLFDYIEKENLEIGITRFTFYHYYTKYEVIPENGVVVYENDFCLIWLNEI